MTMEKTLEFAMVGIRSEITQIEEETAELKQKIETSPYIEMIEAQLEQCRQENQRLRESYLDIRSEWEVEHEVNEFKKMSTEEQWYELGTLMLQINGID